MNVGKESVKMEDVPIRLEVSTVFVHQVLMYRRMEQFVLIMMSVLRLVCVQMEYVSTWMEALSVNAKMDLNYLQLVLHALVNFDYDQIQATCQI